MFLKRIIYVSIYFKKNTKHFYDRIYFKIKIFIYFYYFLDFIYFLFIYLKIYFNLNILYFIIF